MIKLVRGNCPHQVALDSGNYKHPLNKEALKQSCHDKCMYCESKISHIDFAHVEHIKPKAADKYPELEFEWSNLGYACAKCNNAKSDQYDATCPYIDPYQDEPNAHLFSAHALILVKNGSERGEMTINDIELNRPDLLEKRYSRLSQILEALKACHRTQNESLKQLLIDELSKEGEVDKEYSMAVKSLLVQHAA